MARRKGAYTEHGKTKLARLRSARDLSINVAAARIGVNRATLWRLEQGQIDNPRLAWLVNAALFYGVALEDVIEDDWLQWNWMIGGFGDDDFSIYWGDRAPGKPAPLKRKPGEPVRLTRRRS